MFLFLLSGFSTVAFSGDSPINGLLYNVNETTSLLYECQLEKDGLLNCKFTQTKVKRKLNVNRFTEKLNDARNIFHSESEKTESIAQSCTTNQLVVDLMNGSKYPKKDNDGISEETLKWVKTVSGIEKLDLKKLLKATQKFCISKSEVDYLAIAKLSIDKDMRTCEVSSANQFTQSFRQIKDANGINTWVVQGSPAGPCGIVQLSRFEHETDSNGKVTRPNEWNYIAKKSVTNPRGDMGGILSKMSCKDFDENESLYSWRSKDYPIGKCDYINFVVL